MNEEDYDKLTESLGALLVDDVEMGATAVSRATHIAGERMLELFDDPEDFKAEYGELIERIGYWVRVAEQNPPGL